MGIAISTATLHQASGISLPTLRMADKCHSYAEVVCLSKVKKWKD